MQSLPDINVWLALTFSAHPYHGSALKWFDQALSRSCSFCRMTQQGFLRLASNPKAFKSDALSLFGAWEAYDILLGDERVRFEAEPPNVEEDWRALTSDGSFSVKIWNDAFLAAFARRTGLQLVSFDQGFRKYPGLRLKLLR